MKYLIRSVKYFCMLVVLYLAIMAAMYYSGTMAQPLADSFVGTLRLQLLGTLRGWIMLIAVVSLAATYPRFGFCVRRVEGDLEQHCTQLLNAMRACGFELVREENGTLLFRGAGLAKRATLLFEDEIRVSACGREIVIEGIRRGVAKVAWRLEGYLAHLKEN